MMEMCKSICVRGSCESVCMCVCVSVIETGEKVRDTHLDTSFELTQIGNRTS